MDLDFSLRSAWGTDSDDDGLDFDPADFSWGGRSDGIGS